MAHSLPSPPLEVPAHIKNKILSCSKERAVRMGELGLSMNFMEIQDVATMHQNLPTMSEEDSLYAVDENSLEETLRETHLSISSLYKNNKWLKYHQAEAAMVEADLTGHLVRAGLPKEQLENYNLRMKVKRFIDLSKPQPSPNYIPMFVHDLDGLAVANLPQSATFAQACVILHGFLKAKSLHRCNETGEDPKMSDAEPCTWRYQILIRGKGTVFPTCVTLKTEDDWRRMMRMITGSNKSDIRVQERPFAVLTWVRESED